MMTIYERHAYARRAADHASWANLLAIQSGDLIRMGTAYADLTACNQESSRLFCAVQKYERTQTDFVVSMPAVSR
jgi:hypothetical protein